MACFTFSPMLPVASVEGLREALNTERKFSEFTSGMRVAFGKFFGFAE